MRKNAAIAHPSLLDIVFGPAIPNPRDCPAFESDAKAKATAPTVEVATDVLPATNVIGIVGGKRLKRVALWRNTSRSLFFWNGL
jgi:hypothetical protein